MGDDVDVELGDERFRQEKAGEESAACLRWWRARALGPELNPRPDASYLCTQDLLLVWWLLSSPFPSSSAIAFPLNLGLWGFRGTA